MTDAAANNSLAQTNKSWDVDHSDQVVAVRPTNSVGSLLRRRRCAPSHLGGGDDRVSGTDDDPHDDISHNGSSEFGGNPDSADTAELVAPYKAWWGLGFNEQIFGADKQVPGRGQSD